VAGAKYFAGQKPVFAIWGNVGTATTLAAHPTYQAAGLPLLFPEALTNQLSGGKTTFLLTPGFGTTYTLLSDHLAKDDRFKGKKIGFLYQNDGTSIESLEGFKKGATKVDVDVKFERTANSYGAQVQRLKAAGAEVVMYIGNPSQLAVALKESDAIGFKPQWIGSLGITSPDTPKLAGALAEGVMTVNPHASPTGDVPGATEFREAMSKYRPDATQSGFAIFSWSGGKIIVDALKRAGKNLTRESFIKALEETKDLDTGGLLPPVTLGPEDHLASDCLLLLVNKGGKFERDGDFACPAA
jgi:ABC-type branched-subunit amino acid transport system substrate-binding protein